LKAISCLNRLEKLKTVFTRETATTRLDLLTLLQAGPLPLASHTRRLHDLLCFIRAYPDTPEIFQLSDQMLCNFSKRGDVRQFRGLLTNSGIAGTTIEYRFFWPMARWLARHWPMQLQLVWSSIDKDQQARLLKILPLLVPANEASAFDEQDQRARVWLQQLKGETETDAVFYVHRLENIYKTDIEREQLHDDMDLTYRLLPGPDTPVISSTLLPDSKITLQQKPFAQRPVELARYVRRLDYDCQLLRPAQGETLVDLARKTMITHERDLDAFAYGNPHDVTLIDFHDGYQIACIGMVPERRYLLQASYGFLTLKNGMPVAYFPLTTVFNLAEAAFNLFSAFRGGESALIYSRNLGIAHRLFGVNTFIVDPYQLGHNNREGLKSGVWWFYYKLGFRPQDPEIIGLLESELAIIRKSPGYRSDLSVLNRLAAGNMYFSLTAKAHDVDLLPRLEGIATGISRYMATRFGSARESAIRICGREAAALIGIDSKQKCTLNEKRAWDAWSPLILNLDRIDKWPVQEQQELASLVRLKGALQQAEYLHKINQQARLRKAILAFADRVKQS